MSGRSHTRRRALAVDRLDNGMVLLRLNLPDRRSAMTHELTEAWPAAIAQLTADRVLRAVIVTGEARPSARPSKPVFAMALACDLRYVTPEAGPSMPFTSLGIHPGMASTFLLPEVVGLPVAREMFMTGRVLRGADAPAVGLVNQIFPAERLREEVLSIASTIATRAPMATEDLLEGIAAAKPAAEPCFQGALSALRSST